MKVSNCCGAFNGQMTDLHNTDIGISYEQAEICPKCGEHCEYITLNDNKMKLNITPGEWAYKPKVYNTNNRDGVSCGSIISDGWYIAEIQSDCFSNELNVNEESEANATAIVTAVNNTYHKGINPEAVPEMLAQLKNLVYNTLEVDRLPQALVKQLELTIKKATL